MAEPMVENADTALYYVTFGHAFEPTELAADAREIHAKGFRSIIWRNYADPALPVLTTPEIIDRVRRFVAQVTGNGLTCSLDLSSIMPAIFTHEDRVAGPFTITQYQAEIIEPAVRERLSAFLRTLGDLSGAVFGIILPVFNELNLPARWYLSAHIVARYEELYHESLPEILTAFTAAAPPDQHRLVQRYRYLLSRELASVLTELAPLVRNVMGPACRLAVHCTSATERRLLMDQIEFNPVLVPFEIAEIRHAEEVDRRPAAVLTQCKLTAGFPRRPVNFWGENFGSPRDTHSLELISYWTDLLCTHNLAWQCGVFTRDHAAFARIVRQGVAYPFHPSWKKFPFLNQKISLMAAVTKNAVPVSALAVIYPDQTLGRYPADARAVLGRALQTFVFNLVRAGYLFDLLPAASLAQGTVNGSALVMNGRTYTTVLFPFPEQMDAAAWEKLVALVQRQGRVLLMGMPPQQNAEGKNIHAEFCSLLQAAVAPRFQQALHLDTGTAPHELIDMGGQWKKPVWETQGGHTFLKADSLPIGVHRDNLFYIGASPASLSRAALQEICKMAEMPHSVKFPPSAYLNLLEDEEGLVLTLCPCEFNGMVNGDVEYGDLRLQVHECKDCLAVRVDKQTHAIIAHALFGEAEVHIEQ